ncbi:hypothetical protein MRX96_029670 [Rhipicephalus microplus]
MASTDAASLLPENLSLGGGHAAPQSVSSYMGGDSRGSSPLRSGPAAAPATRVQRGRALRPVLLGDQRLPRRPRPAVVGGGATQESVPAFELFLKHLVGGLHTVYTKLKRLGISPIVCNVEQVRVLRGLGAIQPGVNRCKLLSCKDFDSLYKDCTTARSARYLTLGLVAVENPILYCRSLHCPSFPQSHRASR